MMMSAKENSDGQIPGQVSSTSFLLTSKQTNTKSSRPQQTHHHQDKQRGHAAHLLEDVALEAGVMQVSEYVLHLPGIARRRRRLYNLGDRVHKFCQGMSNIREKNALPTG
jgi:hypothetical protein